MKTRPLPPKDRDERLEMWGEGPWIDEPDVVPVEAAYPGLIVRNPGGSLCAYLRLPVAHTLSRGEGISQYSSIPVHGEVTYTALDHDPLGRPDPGSFWLGWDYAHAFDWVPLLAQFATAITSAPEYTAKRQAYGVEDTYWTVDMVRVEVVCAAALLKAIEDVEVVDG